MKKQEIIQELKKGGAGREMTKKVYWVLSGEGETGSWEKKIATERGILRILSRERCGGDRWAHAYGDILETDSGLVGIDIETGAMEAVGC